MSDKVSQSDQDLIARHIAKRGVTVIPAGQTSDPGYIYNHKSRQLVSKDPDRSNWRKKPESVGSPKYFKDASACVSI